MKMDLRKVPHEGLKMIACISMLIDHTGSILFPRLRWLRIVGRIAFPIFCWLLVEGAYHTKNPQKYALRLFIGMLLSEIPYDIALKHGFTWQHQSVMVTLLFGYIALELIRRADNDLKKLCIAFVFYYLANWAHTDYGGYGVLLIVMFSQVRGRLWIQGLLLLMIAWLMKSAVIPVFGFKIKIELFAVFAMIPIALYSGKKVTANKMVQWSFYLFYPVHLLVLYLIKILK